MAVDFGQLVNRDLSNIQQIRARERAADRADSQEARAQESHKDSLLSSALNRDLARRREKRADEAVDYQHGRDKVADERYNSELEYKKGRDAVADERWLETNKLNRLTSQAAINASRAAQANSESQRRIREAEDQRRRELLQLKDDGEDFNRAAAYLQTGDPQQALGILKKMDDRKSIDLNEIQQLDTANMMKVGKGLLSGEIKPNDPRAKELFTTLFSDTMRRTGRDGVYTFKTLVPDPRDKSGQSFLVKMQDANGNVVPATALKLADGEDAPVSVTVDDLTKALQSKITMASQVKNMLAQAAHQKKMILSPQGTVSDPRVVAAQQAAMVQKKRKQAPEGYDLYLATSPKTAEAKYVSNVAKTEQWPVTVLNEANKRIAKRIKEYEDNPTTFFGNPRDFDKQAVIQEEVDAARSEVRAERDKKAAQKAADDAYATLSADPNFEVSKRAFNKIVQKYAAEPDDKKRAEYIKRDVAKLSKILQERNGK